MKVAGLTSGEGRSLMAVADRRPGGAELTVVVTDDPDASVLEGAAERGVATEVLGDGEATEDRIAGTLAEHGIDLVCLDGFDPDLPTGRPEGWPPVVESVPALFPSHGGTDDPVAAAVDGGSRVAVATVRLRGADVDGGPSPVDDGGPRILAQEPLFVPEGGPDRLRERVDEATAVAYVRAVRGMAEEREGVQGSEQGMPGSEQDERGGAEGIDPDRFPDPWLATADRVRALRYGENPHQEAALYAEPTDGASVVGVPQLNEGAKALSYNNYNDADAALSLVGEFERPAATVVKHTNPAGCGTAPSVGAAYDRALSTDPMSAFGGVVALNRECDRDTAAAITGSFKEVVVAPAYSAAALETLRAEENLRVLAVGDLPDPADRPPTVVEKDLAGGRLLQDRDDARLGPGDLAVVTERAPTDEEVESLLFAWRTVKHVKSNAIVFATGTETVGVGAGQMSRVDAVEIARTKAREHAEGKSADGAVMASDAFFPFPDGVEAAAEAGIEAVVQPGGSVNDDDVIAAADELGIAMVLTGRRAFRHD